MPKRKIIYIVGSVEDCNEAIFDALFPTAKDKSLVIDNIDAAIKQKVVMFEKTPVVLLNVSASAQISQILKLMAMYPPDILLLSGSIADGECTLSTKGSIKFLNAFMETKFAGICKIGFVMGKYDTVSPAICAAKLANIHKIFPETVNCKWLLFSENMLSTVIKLQIIVNNLLRAINTQRMEVNTTRLDNSSVNPPIIRFQGRCSFYQPFTPSPLAKVTFADEIAATQQIASVSSSPIAAVD
jgi:hypothetical protein